MNTLYLFTYQYPYATRESFTGDELVYIATKFDKVYIVPEIACKEDTIRKVPSNCIVLTPNLKKNNRITYYLKGLFSFRTIVLVIKEFFNNAVYKDKVKFKNFVSYTLNFNNLVHNSRYRMIEKQITERDVCYFYWGVGRNILSVLWHKKAHMISRFHGDWDLWEESYHGYVPYRQNIVKSLDKAVFISKKGENYFKERYPYCNSSVNPLGSKDCGVSPNSPNDEVIRIISCSAIYNVKRVDLIFKSLNAFVSRQIEWTHIGDGVDFETLKQIVYAEKKSHLTVNLKGRIPHEEVLEYYKSNHFDIFINLSTNEGVPVAIMEASSFNIPVVATNVGGTSEIVTKQVGELVSPNPNTDEVISAICKIIDGNYSPREFWLQHYNAEENYNKFANLVSSL